MLQPLSLQCLHLVYLDLSSSILFERTLKKKALICIEFHQWLHFMTSDGDGEQLVGKLIFCSLWDCMVQLTQGIKYFMSIKKLSSTW